MLLLPEHDVVGTSATKLKVGSNHVGTLAMDWSRGVTIDPGWSDVDIAVYCGVRLGGCPGEPDPHASRIKVARQVLGLLDFFPQSTSLQGPNGNAGRAVRFLE